MIKRSRPIHNSRRLAPGSSESSVALIRLGRRDGKGPNVGRANQASRYRKAHRLRQGWDRDEWDDGRRLSSDPTATLPGERRRPTPRLHRQEAFRAPRAWEEDTVVDDASLYRLGVLYDGDGDDANAHVRGSGFSLDAIVHAEPTYSLRPAKRVKRTYDSRLEDEDLHLSVNLLSTYLAEDAAVARFLSLDHGNFTGRDGGYDGSIATRGSAGSLSIIHELVESSTYSLAPAPAASDFPDLVSDTEEEGGEGYEDGGDWALVSDPDADAAALDADVDVAVEVGEVSSPVDGVWVFIAGDDS
ncbi:hypothetical protein F5Y03DRAFT_140563 [Xylaria venustula]|nr:hypothetical protein F5Y03DRAFT_140563 [Xylaria venustula]